MTSHCFKNLFILFILWHNTLDRNRTFPTSQQELKNRKHILKQQKSLIQLKVSNCALFRVPIVVAPETDFFRAYSTTFLYFY